MELITVLSVHLAGYYQETGTSLADLRDTILGGRSNTLDPIYAHAVERGEIKPGQLTDRMQRLPFDLLRGELTMTLGPYPTKPLWRSSIPSSCRSSGADPATRQQRHSGHELSGHDRIHRATLEGCRHVVPVHDRLQQQCAQQPAGTEHDPGDAQAMTAPSPTGSDMSTSNAPAIGQGVARDGLFQDAFWSAGFSISVVTRAPRKSTGSHRRHASRGAAA